MPLNAIQSRFNKAVDSYDLHCELQLATGEALIHYLKPHLLAKQHVLELGCGTGIVTEKLAKACPFEKFHAIDVASHLLDKASQRLANTNIQLYEINFDALSHPHFFNLVFSNMALQWSRDLSHLLTSISSHLFSDGLCAFSIPLDGTFKELVPHYAINVFYNSPTIIALLESAGYQIQFCHEEAYNSFFESTLSALKSIKHVGASYVNHPKQRSLRGRAFLDNINITQLTYHIGYFIGIKKHSGRQST